MSKLIKKLKLFILAGFILFIFNSCMSAKLDMRELKQPVTMNNNPFVYSEGESIPTLNPVDSYSAEVSESYFYSSFMGQSQSQTDVKNEAQLKAFEKIGGDPSKTITGAKIESQYFAINWLIAMGNFISISATGTVSQVIQNSEKEDL